MKTFDEMTWEEQNAAVDALEREERARIADARARGIAVGVVMPAETAREGYYHAKPDPIA